MIIGKILTPFNAYNNYNVNFKSNNDDYEKFKHAHSVEHQHRFVPRMSIVVPATDQKDAFIRQSDAIDIDGLKSLCIKNFRLIDSNSVRGASLTSAKFPLLKALKDFGISTIIDLRREAGDESSYAKKCANVGLDYFGIPINDSMPEFTTFGKPNAEFIERLSNFFDLMNRGQVYMGCQLGLHRTDLAVSLNYLLNPNEPSAPPTLSHMFFKNEENVTGKCIAAVKNLFRNLSQEDKIKIGLGEYFTDIFNSRISKLKMTNLR